MESFRSFRGPLLHKPVTGQELFFAFSYSKPALVRNIFFINQLFLSIYNKLRLAHFDYGRVHTILECSQHPLPWQFGSKFHPAFFVWFWHILVFLSFCNAMQSFAYVNLSNRSKYFRVIGRTVYSRMLYVFFCLTLILSLKSIAKKICVKNKRGGIIFLRSCTVRWKLKYPAVRQFFGLSLIVNLFFFSFQSKSFKNNVFWVRYVDLLSFGFI